MNILQTSEHSFILAADGGRILPRVEHVVVMMVVLVVPQQPLRDIDTTSA